MDANVALDKFLQSSLPYQYFGGVLLMRGRNPVRMLTRLGVGHEHASRLVERAACCDDDTIVYSLAPGTVQVLEKCGLLWSASAYDLDNVHSTSDEAIAAAELAAKKSAGKFGKARGWCAVHTSLLDAVREAASYLIPQLGAPVVDMIAVQLAIPEAGRARLQGALH